MWSWYLCPVKRQSFYSYQVTRFQRSRSMSMTTGLKVGETNIVIGSRTLNNVTRSNVCFKCYNSRNFVKRRTFVLQLSRMKTRHILWYTMCSQCVCSRLYWANKVCLANWLSDLEYLIFFWLRHLNWMQFKDFNISFQWQCLMWCRYAKWICQITVVIKKYLNWNNFKEFLQFCQSINEALSTTMAF